MKETGVGARTDSVFGIATAYELEDLGIEFW
jgi:hypothetical protein